MALLSLPYQSCDELHSEATSDDGIPAWRLVFFQPSKSGMAAFERVLFPSLRSQLRGLSPRRSLNWLIKTEDHSDNLSTDSFEITDSTASSEKPTHSTHRQCSGLLHWHPISKQKHWIRTVCFHTIKLIPQTYPYGSTIHIKPTFRTNHFYHDDNEL
jgi:hypothetical protein